MEKASYRGSIVENGEDQEYLTDLTGVAEINADSLIEIEIEAISDNEFNKLLIGEKRVEISVERQDADLKLLGQIMGGSDQTRPVRAIGEKIEAKQNLTILLEKALNKEQKEALIGERIKFIVYAKN